jgi:hypothetical protein
MAELALKSLQEKYANFQFRFISQFWMYHPAFYCLTPDYRAGMSRTYWRIHPPTYQRPPWQLVPVDPQILRDTGFGR